MIADGGNSTSPWDSFVFPWWGVFIRLSCLWTGHTEAGNDQEDVVDADFAVTIRIAEAIRGAVCIRTKRAYSLPITAE